MDVIRSFQKYGTILLLAVAGGFCGSSLHEWTKVDSDVIRAKRYEVVGQSGKILRFLGPGRQTRKSRRGPLEECSLVFMDPDGVRRAQIGSRVGDYAPELLFMERRPVGKRNSGVFVPTAVQYRAGLQRRPIPNDAGPEGLASSFGCFSRRRAECAGRRIWRIAFVSGTGAGASLGARGQ